MSEQHCLQRKHTVCVYVCVGVGVGVWVCGCGCVGVGVWVWVWVCLQESGERARGAKTQRVVAISLGCRDSTKIPKRE